jgi:hypothetical protein
MREHDQKKIDRTYDILPHKKISSVKFKLGQKFDTNNIDLGTISTKEKFTKLLKDNPDLQIIELPQNAKQQIKINIIVYTIEINREKIETSDMFSEDTLQEITTQLK